jgi:hypothetical protein
VKWWIQHCDSAASEVEVFGTRTAASAAADSAAHPAAAAEPEFALWLEAIANGGSYEQLADALAAMAGELNAVRGSTLQLVERFFKCAALFVAALLCRWHVVLVFILGVVCLVVPCLCTWDGGWVGWCVCMHSTGLVEMGELGTQHSCMLQAFVLQLVERFFKCAA